jgi:hypothetical protein
MEPSRDEVLFATLESLRPTPAAAFAAELDARVADGFPRRSPSSTPWPAALAARVTALRPRRLILGGGGAALAIVAIAAVIVAGSGSNSGSDHLQERARPSTQGGATLGYLNKFDSSEPAEVVPEAPNVQPAPKAEESSSSAGTEAASPEYATTAPTKGANSSSGPYASQTHHRAVEYAAEMTLGAKPEDVGDAAGKVFDAVHQYRGIVLDSSVSGGSESDAGAEFELLIPSAKLSDALAAFSGIADVRSRHETSNDITAPTVTTTELLQDSHARIESLLNQLAETETETERDAVEAKLRGERRHAAVLKSSLTNLQRRASLSQVSLKIESDASGAGLAGGGWDVGDAFHDAGHILAVAAGVAIVGLAVVGPLALIALLAWLAHRTWVRQRRERALG